MFRRLSLFALLTSLLLSTGCARRLTDFSVVSTKNDMLTDDSRIGAKVTGMDCVPVVVVQWGEPSLAVAIEEAIESAGPGYDALIDVAVDYRYEHFFFGRNCWKVEGTAVSRGATSKATARLE